ncbi:MAG: alkaline phosphatase D family protein [Sumerlaeia bacterium]
MKRTIQLSTAFAAVILAFTGCASNGTSGSSEGTVGASLMNTVASSLSGQLSTQTFDLNSIMSLTQLASSPEGQQELASKVVTALQGYLYGGPEEIAAAAAEGRGVNLNPETLEVSVTDTAEKQTEALGFFSQLQGLTTREGIINKLSELALGKPKGTAANGGVSPAERSITGADVDYALIGNITPSSATFTIKTGSAGEYSLALEGPSAIIQSVQFSTTQFPGTSTFRGTARANRLVPNSDYKLYTLDDENKVVANFRTPAETPERVRLFFGSCMNYDQATARETQYAPKNDPTATAQVVEIENHQLWQNIPATSHFDAAFLIGDRFYLPGRYEDYDNMNPAEFMSMIDEHHEGMMSTPGLQKFFSRTPLYVTWDDHDFGPNNSATDFKFSQEALQHTAWSLPQPEMGTPELPGVYFKTSFGELDVFVLDGRSFRDCSNRTFTRGGITYRSCGVDGIEQPNGEFLPEEMLTNLYGPEQMYWLKTSLKQSNANVKLIVTGNQSLSNIHKWEAWYHYAEREEFLNWLNANPIPGVLFVGGDRHHGEVGVLTSGTPYPLYELTASGLGTNTYGPDIDTPETRYQILGDTGMQHYGVVEYDRTAASVSLVLIGRDGTELHRTTVPVSELKS